MKKLTRQSLSSKDVYSERHIMRVQDDKLAICSFAGKMQMLLSCLMNRPLGKDACLAIGLRLYTTCKLLCRAPATA